MSEPDFIQDLVVLFDAAGTVIEHEFSCADFDSLCRGERPLVERGGETVRAAYVTVGPGLRVVGIAFFLLPVDAAGGISEAFNVPLSYLVENAGVRAEFGLGAVKVASRAQCPVPWLSLKLWEPAATHDGPARLIQRAVLLNRLGLRSMPQAGGPSGTAANDGAATPAEPASTGLPEARPPTAAPPRPGVRQELLVVEQGYLEQIRKFRAEVLELKAALRAERERNRRLQALLRGEV